jgi:hypothetical protein
MEFLETWVWRPWDQAGSIANARGATAELSRARAERDEIVSYIEHLLSERRTTQSA